MVRPLRLEFPGALYHVISRGNERGPIFVDDLDRFDFLDLLGSVVLKETFRLHAYCLLGNHYHLLVETPEGRISRGMHQLNARYAQRFNRRHDRCGHLFEGRFKAIIVQRQLHLLELHRYIVLNPVRAGLVLRPEDWRWSSYRAASGLAPTPSWLQTDWTLSQFGRTTADARRAFVAFVEAAVDCPPATAPVRNQLFLGSADFLAKMRNLLEEKPWDTEIPVAQRTPNAPELIDIEEAVSRAWGLTIPELLTRRAGPARVAAIYLARKLTHLPAREIAEPFGVSRGRVANVVAEVEGGKHREIQDRLDKLIEDIGRAKTVKKTGQKCQVKT
ncbi:MAG TPA: transposase [Thermoanaerobaculia bacterium]|nr:transposase [Thermoanaerobaculia bacterium]